MYSRFSRNFCKKFISLAASSKKKHLSIILSYQGSPLVLPSVITSESFITNQIQNSYLLNLSSRGVNTTATMNSQNKININYEQLLKEQKDDNVLIVDVREQSEINKTDKLPGSIHIPMANVSNTLQNLSEKDFMERYNKPKPTKHTKIIFSCQSGRRSGAVQEEMQKLGYNNVYNYIGGWQEWENKQKAKSK